VLWIIALKIHSLKKECGYKCLQIKNKGFIVELYYVSRKHLDIKKKSTYWDRLWNELYWVRLEVERDFSFLHNAHTSSGSDPAPYSVDKGKVIPLQARSGPEGGWVEV